MLTRSKIIHVGLSIGLAPLLLLLCSISAPAKEVKFPTPSYEGEELAKVKEWEKTWAGKKIDKSNVQRIQPYSIV